MMSIMYEKDVSLEVTMKPSIIQRFLSKIKISDTGCWEWTACKLSTGHGQFWNVCKLILAHRYSYEYYHGQIDSKLILHHECENPRCVNVNHLKPMTQGEHALLGDSPFAKKHRQTHCIHGHEFTEENTAHYGSSRDCKTCARLNSLRQRQKKLPLEERTL